MRITSQFGYWHAQRPGKGLQAKQSESLCAQDSAIQKADQNRNMTVPELVPEAFPRTQSSFFFLPENVRGQTELGQDGKSVSYPRV